MMPQTTFPVIIIAIILAALVSLSAFAHAYADTEVTPGKKIALNRPHDTVQTAKVPDHGNIPDYSKCAGASSCAVRAPSGNDNGGGGSSSGHHHDGKIGKINRLFRSNNNIDTGQAALDSIPVIQPLTPEQLNGTNATKTATVTIPVCDGIVPGPCLDKTTGQIIP
jgi:hypothetical protein